MHGMMSAGDSFSCSRLNQERGKKVSAMNTLNKTLLLTFVLLFSLAGYAEAKSYWYSPLTAIAHAGAGHRLKISVSQHHSPPSAVRITADEIVEDGDPQWIRLGLTVPSGTLKHLKLCYQVIMDSPGTTYISQVRLTKMTVLSTILCKFFMDNFFEEG